VIFQKYSQEAGNVILENNNELLKNKLLDEFKNNALTNLDEYTIGEIKDIICFEILNEKDSYKEKFIYERIAFVNQNNIFKDNSSERCDSSDEIKWYRINGREELKRAIKIEEFYEFIILNKNCKFDDYSYSVRFTETASDFVLEVKERKDGNVIKNIFPKISKLIPNIVLQLD
jgi:hypothetical protein